MVAHDVTEGAADAVALAAALGQMPALRSISPSPLPGAPYDLLIGDLLYSQLLYPALLDLGVPAVREAELMTRHAPILTRSVFARLHVSAPNGRVLHIHDPIAWWPGHPQPVALERILAVAEHDCAAALALAGQGTGPRHSDPRTALRDLGIPVGAPVLWHWPFAPAVDYLACATLAPSRLAEPRESAVMPVGQRPDNR